MEAFITEKFTAALEEINERLEQKPGRIIAVVPGMQISWDDCCEGQLAARLVSLTPIMTEGSSMVRCSIKFWQAVGEISLLRCSTALEDDGTFPLPAKINDEGIGLLKDTDAIVAALDAQDWVSAIGAWTPLGPNGGCAGIQIQFNFNLDSP